MRFFPPIIFLLGISQNVFGKGIQRERSNNQDKLSYQDLINMGISCDPEDSCEEVRSDDPPVPEFGGKCSCHNQCWEYGTCCIDSPYRFKPPIKKCLDTGYRSYYMVHRCPDNTHPDSIWRNHCESELGETDDILMISPVTSLDTSRTYKNYYCFRCHESTDKYVSWNLELRSFYNAPPGASVYKIAYNQTGKTWVAILDKRHDPIPANLSFVFPQNVQGKPMMCHTSHVISDCPEGADERVHAKCLAYSAIVHYEFDLYKNAHCAVCNNVPLYALSCYSKWGSGGLSGVDDTIIYTFKIDGRDEDGKQEQCKGDYNFWNSNTKNCVNVICLRPEHVVKNGICIKSSF